MIKKQYIAPESDIYLIKSGNICDNIGATSNPAISGSGPGPGGDEGDGFGKDSDWDDEDWED